MGQKLKYYVVWAGREPGIYQTWSECQRQVKGFKGARFKAYPSEQEARRAFILEDTTLSEEDRKTAREAIRISYSKTAPRTLPGEVETMALAVDAACSGNPGKMEYRGVLIKTGEQLFHFGPVLGTNNIGEFLAIVHGLALLRQRGVEIPIYSDSVNAIKWVHSGKCRTTLKENEHSRAVFELIHRAEKWLSENGINVPIRKWETSRWGEIPADFGRK